MRRWTLPRRFRGGFPHPGPAGHSPSAVGSNAEESPAGCAGGSPAVRCRGQPRAPRFSAGSRRPRVGSRSCCGLSAWFPGRFSSGFGRLCRKNNRHLLLNRIPDPSGSRDPKLPPPNAGIPIDRVKLQVVIQGGSRAGLARPRCRDVFGGQYRHFVTPSCANRSQGNPGLRDRRSTNVFIQSMEFQPHD